MPADLASTARCGAFHHRVGHDPLPPRGRSGLKRSYRINEPSSQILYQRRCAEDAAAFSLAFAATFVADRDRPPAHNGRDDGCANDLLRCSGVTVQLTCGGTILRRSTTDVWPSSSTSRRALRPP